MDSSDKKQDMQNARIFSNTFTFKDDLCTFSNDDFENNYNIYPDLPNPEKVNNDLCKSSFLDFSIEVYYWKFITEIFDKKDVFPLYINCVPNLDSNIPFKNSFMTWLVQKFYVLPGQKKDMINMALLDDLLSSSLNN